MGALTDGELPRVPASRPERLLAALAALALLLLCAIVTTTVVVRSLGFVLIPDDVLLVQELMLWIILLPLAAVVAQRQQIAISVFTTRVSLRGQRVLALLGHLVGLVFAGALLWVGVRFLFDAVASREYHDGILYLPTWTGYAVFSVGIGAFLLRLLAMCVIDLRALRQDSPPA